MSCVLSTNINHTLLSVVHASCTPVRRRLAVFVRVMLLLLNGYFWDLKAKSVKNK